MIEDVRVYRARVPLVSPFVTAVRRADSADVVVVRVTDGAGCSGWGEAAISWHVTGESPESVAATVSGPLAQVIIGKDPADPALPTEVARAVWGNAAARSAVECALADLSAQRMGEPLHRRLGGVARTISTDMTLSVAAPEALTRRAAMHVAEGFRVLKIKVQDPVEAIEGIRAVRSAIGDEIVLRVDANQAWEISEAIRTIRALEEYHLEFVEQPVPAGDIEGLARVSAAVSTPIMADESVRSAADVRLVARSRAASLVNIKIAKTGGLAEALRAAKTAADAGISVVVGCMLEGSVGVGAAASLASAIAPDSVHDLDTIHWLRRTAVRGGAVARGNEITLSDAPGLGIDGFDGDEIARVGR